MSRKGSIYSVMTNSESPNSLFHLEIRGRGGITVLFGTACEGGVFVDGIVFLSGFSRV